MRIKQFHAKRNNTALFTSPVLVPLSSLLHPGMVRATLGILPVWKVRVMLVWVTRILIPILQALEGKRVIRI